MSELRIRNWDKWQSYRKDRGQPPWIKLHRQVMRNPEWVSLTDAQRGQLVAIWLLAADRSGVIPASPSVLLKLCHLDSEPDLKLFMDKGFIEPDASVTPDRRQHDAPETETETETETEKKEDAAPSGAHSDLESSPPSVPDADYYRRAKQIIGPSGGGLAKKLLDAKDGNLALARAAIETASTKADPREYLGAIIRGRNGSDDLRARGDAW